jgi:iron complex outermembrane receptor protein
VVTPEVFNRTQATNVEQVVRKLPSIDFTGGTSANTNNNGFGGAQIGMRNLTPARTLVLVNGQRFPYTDTPVPTGGVDIGNIPLPMLNRVEVLRDGASSIYGADAIAGVVNMITKTDFEGISVNTEFGTTDKWDGQRWGAGILMGANFDKGNIMVFLGTDNRSPIWQSSRKWSAATYVGTIREGAGSTSGRLTGLTGTVSGVGNIQFYTSQGYISPSQPGYVLSNAVSTINPLPPDWVLLPGTPNQLGVSSAPRLAYSFVRHQYLSGYNHKKTANFIGHYDIFPDVTAIAEAFFTVRDSGEQLSPDPIGFNITTLKYGGLMIPALLPDGTDNPYNPFPNNITNALYRPSNGPARLYRDNVTTMRFRAGLEGHLFTDYDWRVGYQMGQSDALYRVTGSTNFDHLSKLSGQVACGNDVRIGCSVANFTGINTLTQTQLNYLFYTNTRNAQTSQSMFYGSISGPVIDLPAGPLAIAIGGEHRQESGFDKPDSIVIQGDGNADAQATQGHYTITSAYAEASIPILKDEWFAESLTASVSGRFDSTSTFGEAETYKFGIDYAINQDIRLRATQSTGFRAPQIKELYGGAFQSFPQGNDPCKNNGGVYARTAVCVSALTAVGADPNTFVDSNVQFRTINGGNPNLQAETSRSQTLGIVLTPHWIDNLSFSFDYYRIFIKGPITTISPQAAANNCYNPAINLQSACALITRQQGTGAIIQVLGTNLNAGSQEVKGFDLGADYKFAAADVGLPDVGGFILNLNANMQDNNFMTDIGGIKTEMAGHYATGAFGAQPRLKYTLNMTFNSDDGWSFNWISRYVGHLENVDRTTYRPASVCANNCGQYLGNFSNGFFYHDVSVSYQWRNIGMTVGMDNVFDKDPPFLSDLFTNSITSGPFDYTGRYVYGKLRLDL